MRSVDRMREVRKGFFLTFIFCLLTLTVEAAQYTGWRLDGTAAAEMPRSFRFGEEILSAESRAARRGVDTLFASGSGQPSGAAFSLLYAQIREAAGEGATLYLVDLRQESHGFVNDGVPVSWYEPQNGANLGCDAATVRAREEEQLSDLIGTDLCAVPLGKTDTKTLTAYTARVIDAASEEVWATAAGFQYVRFAAADQRFPEPEAVDDFLHFFQTLPEGAWLHFHCHAGHGRTTTYLVFYDILKHPEEPLETIAEHHRAIGGADLLAASDVPEIADRAKKLRLFYDYVKAQRESGFAVPWSQWIAARG